MNKKKAIICTIMFSIVIISIITALMFMKPLDSEINLFYAFSPFIVGHWLSERIGKFYDWLMRN